MDSRVSCQLFQIRISMGAGKKELINIYFKVFQVIFTHNQGWKLLSQSIS